ncbi:F-box domain-containing protein [Mycena sanguinolenta]|uniref:F-box domain-containing protein n=1 Tax=Mycena sanguinolenta TaxID=230812 RepID=A0A8H7DK42_9AGAR|nr:F-box domain-containing protein [Mycena sanguinolenta]
MSIVDWDRKDNFVDPHLRHFLQTLLRSHSPPPRGLSSSTVSVLAEDLEKYDAQIAQLKDDSDDIGPLKSRRSALEAYYLECRGLLAPIRRIPSEILIEIFRLCRSFEPDLSFSRAADRAFCGMTHLAQESLLRIAHVCHFWHETVMGTPTLWSTVSLHASALSGTAQQCKTTVKLLEAVLQRSGSMPLTVKSYPFDGHGQRFKPALKLLASHCARWRTARILNSPFDFQYLSSIQNNLPLLTTLELYIGGASLDQLDLLAFVQNVKNLTVHGSIEFAIAKLPLAGLMAYNSVDLRPHEIKWTVASLSRLSYPCAIVISIEISGYHPSGLGILHTTSNIGRLGLRVNGFCSVASTLQILDDMFGVLTLPTVHDLIFAAQNPLPWPHTQFIGLSIRSSFNTHLYSLNLHCVKIAQQQLIDCLYTLSALQRLYIADHFPKPLVTDSLLMALARPPANSTITYLVPHLRVLGCISELRFDDNIYLKFLVSRCTNADGALNGVPFCDQYALPIGILSAFSRFQCRHTDTEHVFHECTRV